MSIQGVFNTQVTKDDRCMGEQWLGADHCLCCLSGSMVLYRERQRGRLSESRTEIYAFRWCDRCGHHLDSHQEYRGTWPGKISPSYCYCTACGILCDTAFWSVRNGQRALFVEKTGRACTGCRGDSYIPVGVKRYFDKSDEICKKTVINM